MINIVRGIIKKIKICDYILVLLSCGIAFMLNSHVNLFGDDFITFEQIRNYNISELIYNLRYDAHPPIFYILLKFYSGLVGTSIHALKSFNVISYVLLIFGAYVCGRLIGSRRYALISAYTLMLFPCMLNNPILFLRMYLLASLFIMLASVFAYKVYVSSSSIYRVAFVFFSLCACFSHYYGTFFVALVHLFLYFSLLRRDSRRWKQCLLYAFLPILAFSIWLPIFLQQLSLKTATIADKTPFLPRLIKSIIYPFYTGTHLPGQSLIVYMSSFVLLFLSFYLVGIIVYHAHRGLIKIEYVERNSLIISIGLPFVIMLALVIIGGLTKPIWFGAYITLFFPIMALGLGWMVYKLDNRRLTVLWFSVLSLCFMQKFYLQNSMCHDSGYANYKALYDKGIISTSDIIIEANQTSSIYFDKVSQYKVLDSIPYNWYRFQYDHIRGVSDYGTLVRNKDRFFSTVELNKDVSFTGMEDFKIDTLFHFNIAYFVNSEAKLYLYKRHDKEI